MPISTSLHDRAYGSVLSSRHGIAGLQPMGEGPNVSLRTDGGSKEHLTLNLKPRKASSSVDLPSDCKHNLLSAGDKSGEHTQRAFTSGVTVGENF